MMKITTFKETTDFSGLKERTFEMQYDDGQKFQYTLVKEFNGEWVLQGDSRARYCLDEIAIITAQLETMNDKNIIHGESPVESIATPVEKCSPEQEEKRRKWREAGRKWRAKQKLKNKLKKKKK